MVGRYPTNKLIGRNPLPQQHPKAPFTLGEMSLLGPFGITHRFQRLFRSEGYVGYVLLTLSPLYSPEGFRARLACLIHTASVRSEPGSNPSVEFNLALFFWSLTSCQAEASQAVSDTLALKFKSHPVFKEPRSTPWGHPVPCSSEGAAASGFEAGRAVTWTSNARGGSRVAPCGARRALSALGGRGIIGIRPPSSMLLSRKGRVPVDWRCWGLQRGLEA